MAKLLIKNIGVLQTPVGNYAHKGKEQGENLKLQNKADEIKLIDRAKKCLMQYLKFSEPQAHRYIEKQAMDTRQTRKEVAKRILSVYEN